MQTESIIDDSVHYKTVPHVRVTPMEVLSELVEKKKDQVNAVFEDYRKFIDDEKNSPHILMRAISNYSLVYSSCKTCKKPNHVHEIPQWGTHCAQQYCRNTECEDYARQQGEIARINTEFSAFVNRLSDIFREYMNQYPVYRTSSGLWEFWRITEIRISPVSGVVLCVENDEYDKVVRWDTGGLR